MSLVIFLFKVRTACPECGEAVILDGPVRSVRCDACQSQLDLGAQWKRIFEFRSNEKITDKVVPILLGFASEYTLHLRMGPEWPRCTACSAQLDLSKLAHGTDGEVACTCGQTMSTYPAPAWLRELHPPAVQLFNAAREDQPREAPVVPQANRPVSFGCPDCGANLKISASTPRILECQYCKTDLYLPDPLWRALHPVRKRSAWYVAFSTAAPPG